MSVNSDDREAYEEGRKRYEDPVDGFINDLGDAIFGSDRSESEQEAFEKGRRGEQLDEDEGGF